MLPYAPVQMLLFSYPDGVEMTDCLVMTSGNVSGAPICRSDEDALEQISGFCDCILSHDRIIRTRADDSVMDFFEGKPYMIRRSRGYSPLPFLLSGNYRGKILAVGGELKNTFCIGIDSLFYPSSYIGDLARRSGAVLKETIERYEGFLGMKPDAVACDLHPGYQSTEIARSYGLPLVQVQHHYAHILSCMAENDCPGPVLGVSFDGTGYGTDGTIWGGELLGPTTAGSAGWATSARSPTPAGTPPPARAGESRRPCCSGPKTADLKPPTRPPRRWNWHRLRRSVLSSRPLSTG